MQWKSNFSDLIDQLYNPEAGSQNCEKLNREYLRSQKCKLRSTWFVNGYYRKKKIIQDSPSKPLESAYIQLLLPVQQCWSYPTVSKWSPETTRKCPWALSTQALTCALLFHFSFTSPAPCTIVRCWLTFMRSVSCNQVMKTAVSPKYYFSQGQPK